MTNSKVIPIWKKVGQSTHVIAKSVAEKMGIKTAHTGTLDPMAEGVIIILAGEERFKKETHAMWKKTYEFEIAFGISTDSYDGLGLITFANLNGEKIGENGTKSNLEKIESIKTVLKKFKGKYTQTVPPYSAIKIKGKPMHWYARNGKLSEVELPKRSGEVYNIELISLNEILLEKLITNLGNKIDLVQGDLRQAKIKKRWQEFVKILGSSSKNDQTMPQATPKLIQIAKIKAVTSKGLYIRSLSQDICKKLGTVGFVSDLVRTKNGYYTKSDTNST